MLLFREKSFHNIFFGFKLYHCTINIIRTHQVEAFKSLNKIHELRRNEAFKSVFVVFNSSVPSLLNHFHNFGRISNVFLFDRFDKNYALIEYHEETSLTRLARLSQHFPNERRIPLESHSYYFTGFKPRHKKSNISTKCHVVEDFNNIKFQDNELIKSKNVEEQIKLIYEKQKLSELDVRLRFFIASEVERLAQRIFPEATVFLFGSSVTGLGRFDGDVDMNLKIENQKKKIFDQPSLSFFMSKIRPENERTFSQQLLEIFGCLLKHVTPQIMQTRLILRARVPLVKFIHAPTDISCDLCSSNQEAIEMSETLYSLFKIPHAQNVCLPLIFTIRQWAKCNKVTQSNPGPWLSNFMITLLVIFHLQTQKLLPPFKNIRNHYLKSSKPENLELILLDFFKFYSQFDFNSHGISVFEASTVLKPKFIHKEVNLNLENNFEKIDHYDNQNADGSFQPLYLENPTVRSLNAAKNVLENDLNHFKNCCAEAYKALTFTPSPSPSSSQETVWGLLKILSVEQKEENKEEDEKENYDSNDLLINKNKKYFLLIINSKTS